MNIHCKAANAGRLISRGHGRHSTRVIDSWELILVLKSEIRMFVGGEKYSVPAGKCLLLPPGIRHGGLSPYTENLSFFWIHFYPKDKKSAELLKLRPTCFAPDNPARLSEYLQLFLVRQEEVPEDRTALDLLLELILHEAFQLSGALKEVFRRDLIEAGQAIHRIEQLEKQYGKGPIKRIRLFHDYPYQETYPGIKYKGFASRLLAVPWKIAPFMKKYYQRNFTVERTYDPASFHAVYGSQQWDGPDFEKQIVLKDGVICIAAY